MEGKSPFSVIDIGGGMQSGIIGRLKGVLGAVGSVLPGFPRTSLASHKASRAIGPSMEPRRSEIVSSVFSLTSLYFMNKVNSPAQDNDPFFKPLYILA